MLQLPHVVPTPPRLPFIILKRQTGLRACSQFFPINMRACACQPQRCACLLPIFCSRHACLPPGGACLLPIFSNQHACLRVPATTRCVPGTGQSEHRGRHATDSVHLPSGGSVRTSGGLSDSPLLCFLRAWPAYCAIGGGRPPHVKK